MDPLIRLLIIIVQSYIIGSIPVALIIGKSVGGIDVRKHGSGNLGSTNVFRILGWRWGVLVQILDICKGFLAVGLVAYFFDTQMPFQNRTPFEDATVVKLIAGLSAVVGHIWSVFAGFKGGKGINTSVGLLLAMAPVEVAVAAGVFLLLLFASGYVSLGSIIAAITVPGTMAIRHNIFGVQIEGYQIMVHSFIGLAILVLYSHRANVKRLLAGTENRFAKLQLFKRWFG
ncbi:MAG: glycerol-3-phosphate 1-O-acyltransferase PlsY [Ignavibacteria bacterium]|nr:glycerol-3-phosphate 1-O-acyltransferase PlsY [Ignavibacteria bacterium]